MSDEILYDLCLKYGRQALLWRQKFIGLLPEVNRRRLFEKKGFGSIFEFAKKLAGLSEEQVRLALNLEKRFEDKPALRAALVEGEVSLNKLARVVSIATPENEAELVAQIRVLPKAAVETLVRDFKIENGLFKPKFYQKSLPGQTLKLSLEVTKKLLALQDKGLDLDALLLEFLEKRDLEIQEEKAELAAECEQTSSRYIPLAIRQIIEKEHGEKCAIPHCKNLSENIHHTDRFSLSQRHNPYFLAPLCKNHHTLAHTVDERVQEKRGTALTAVLQWDP